jgi:putative DNA primase/helicase
MLVSSLQEKERQAELEEARPHPNPDQVTVTLPDAVRVTEVEDEAGQTRAAAPPAPTPTVTVTVTPAATPQPATLSQSTPAPTGHADPRPAQCARDLIDGDDFEFGGDLGRWGRPDDPLETARKIEARWRNSDGDLLIRHWRDSWWWFNGRSWEQAEEGHLRSYVYQRLEQARWPKTVRVGGGSTTVPEPWKPNRNTVGNVLDATQAVTYTRSDVEQPAWLDGPETLSETGTLVSLANCLLEPLTLTQRPHTPRYFVGFDLPFAYDPEARCPEWERFLESVWPGDDESKLLLREWFGYVISGKLDRHKMLFMIGAKRSGKGTISRTLRKLIGEVNVAAPTLSSLANNFGLQSLIGRPLAVIGDARLGKADTQLIIERLLMISGGDPIDVDRKNRPVWTGVLPSRIMMSSNETPWFKDASGAISSRMLLLDLPVSFLGREDLGLEDRLAAELPGIFNWALDGLRELEQHSQFVVPAASAEVTRELIETVSPITTFIEEELIVDHTSLISVTELMARWIAWSGRDSVDSTQERRRFGSQLKTAVPGLKKTREMIDGRREVFYCGVTLRNKMPEWARPTTGG